MAVFFVVGVASPSLSSRCLLCGFCSHRAPRTSLPATPTFTFGWAGGVQTHRQTREREESDKRFTHCASTNLPSSCHRVFSLCPWLSAASPGWNSIFSTKVCPMNQTVFFQGLYAHNTSSQENTIWFMRLRNITVHTSSFLTGWLFGLTPCVLRYTGRERGCVHMRGGGIESLTPEERVHGVGQEQDQ